MLLKRREDSTATSRASGQSAHSQPGIMREECLQGCAVKRAGSPTVMEIPHLSPDEVGSALRSQLPTHFPMLKGKQRTKTRFTMHYTTTGDRAPRSSGLRAEGGPIPG